MDWSVTARTAVPHVREVDADRELTTWLLVDASPSMEYGTAELDKRELAVAAVATIGFLTAGPATGSARRCSHRTGCTGCRPGVGVPTCSGCCVRCWPRPGPATTRTSGPGPRPSPGCPTRCPTRWPRCAGSPTGVVWWWWSPTSSTACPTTHGARPAGSVRYVSSRFATRCSRSR